MNELEKGRHIFRKRKIERKEEKKKEQREKEAREEIKEQTHKCGDTERGK
jgi:hypothetical protein